MRLKTPLITTSTAILCQKVERMRALEMELIMLYHSMSAKNLAELADIIDNNKDDEVDEEERCYEDCVPFLMPSKRHRTLYAVAPKPDRSSVYDVMADLDEKADLEE